jgi:hypothetical protein
MPKNPIRVGIYTKMSRMNLKCCKTLLVLNEEELKECNGGMVVFPELTSKLPTIVCRIPLPDGDHRL